MPGRLGGCDQDCAFCAQSVRYDTHIEKKAQILSDDEILAGAKEAKEKGVPNFGIVYSGKRISDGRLRDILKTMKDNRLLKKIRLDERDVNGSLFLYQISKKGIKKWQYYKKKLNQ